MRPRSLAILALLVLGLGAFVWFWERKQPGTAERELEAKKVLAGVEQKDVREVLLQHGGGAEVRLVRETPPGGADEGDADGGAEEGDALDVFADAAEWRLVTPVAARADRMAVDALLQSLLGLEKARTIEDVDRGEYGLAPPAAKVTLVTGEGRRTLEVGREIPGTDQRVVALDGGDEAWTVAAAFWNELTKPAGDWRSRQLFPGQRHEVERVAVRRGGQAVVLARRGDDFWLEAPVADRADRERVDDFLAAVTGLEAVEFLAAAEEAGAGLAAPEAVIEVMRQGRRESFRVVLGATRAEGEEPVRVARVDGQLVTVRSPALDEAIARPPQDWRSRAWTALPVYDVDRVEVRDAQGASTLVRADADWKRDGVKIFYGPVSDLLAAVTDARAERLVPAGEATPLIAGAPVFTLRLVGREAKEETLKIWAAGEGGAPARVTGRDVVLLLPADLPATLAQRLQAVRQAEPLPEPTPGDPDAAAGGQSGGDAGAGEGRDAGGAPP